MDALSLVHRLQTPGTDGIEGSLLRDTYIVILFAR
jgi:hypothetical protein